MLCASVALSRVPGRAQRRPGQAAQQPAHAYRKGRTRERLESVTIRVNTYIRGHWTGLKADYPLFYPLNAMPLTGVSGIERVQKRPAYSDRADRFVMRGGAATGGQLLRQPRRCSVGGHVP